MKLATALQSLAVGGMAFAFGCGWGACRAYDKMIHGTQRDHVVSETEDAAWDARTPACPITASKAEIVLRAIKYENEVLDANRSGVLSDGRLDELKAVVTDGPFFVDSISFGGSFAPLIITTSAKGDWHLNKVTIMSRSKPTISEAYTRGWFEIHFAPEEFQ